MADMFLSMPNNSVGLIVRGKLSPDHEPRLLDQHADCVLPDGSPIGFYGTGNGGSGNSSGIGMNGVVWDFSILSSTRVYYVDFDSAVAYGAVATLLIVPATKVQCDAFVSAWSSMQKKPGSFSLLGNNCSTHASNAFVSAGLLKGGIPGLDTPNNLYNQLVKAIGGVQSLSGYFGFIKNPSGGYRLKFREYAKNNLSNSPANRAA
jgi:hypothetical protein